MQAELGAQVDEIPQDQEGPRATLYNLIQASRSQQVNWMEAQRSLHGLSHLAQVRDLLQAFRRTYCGCTAR